jgi:hypothetical protein
MTNEQKRLLARILLTQAGNIVEFWSEIGRDLEAEGIDAKDAAVCLSSWLRALPGTEWDTRLPLPNKKNAPA